MNYLFYLFVLLPVAVVVLLSWRLHQAQQSQPMSPRAARICTGCHNLCTVQVKFCPQCAIVIDATMQANTIDYPIGTVEKAGAR